MANQDYTVRQLFEMQACTNCQFCADVCPAVTASREGKLSAVYRMKGLREILKSRSAFFRFLGKKELSDEQWSHFSETVFRCTLCGNCQETCPVGIGLKNLWLSLRQDLVHSEHYPKKIDMIRENLLESRNVFAEDNEERAEWVEDMDEVPEDGLIREKAEVIYFTGCVAAYFPMAQNIPIALAEILEAAGVNFTLLGEDEWCCGFPMLGAGLKELFAEFKEHNLSIVRKKEAKTVIFACPSCFQMWKEHYDAPVEIAHASQFLLKLLKQDKIPLKPLSLKVTYHDPCDLGRGARVFDEPRDIIKSLPGIDFVELERNRGDCQCCGGGGNLEMIDASLSADIAKQKIDEILATGAQAVVTSCQQCVRTMATFVRRNKIPLQVMDVTQLIRRALKQ